MQSPLVLLLSTLTLWSLPFAEDCVFFPNLRGDRVLIACRPADELLLTVYSADGRSTQVGAIDQAVRGGVPTGPAAWSPSGDRVALEIGLDEEPGILLISLLGKPSAIFVDQILVDANVSGAQPQWDPSGEWLIFATSGTGDWKSEGVYAMRVRDGVVFRLLSVVPRRMRIAGDFLYLDQLDRADPSRSDLKAFRLSALLKSGHQVAASRERIEKR
jgi:hypothetical protein